MSKQTNDAIGKHDFIFKYRPSDLYKTADDFIRRLENRDCLGYGAYRQRARRSRLISSLEIVRGIALLRELRYHEKSLRDIERNTQCDWYIDHNEDNSVVRFGRNTVTVTESRAITTLSLRIATDEVETDGEDIYETPVPDMLEALKELKVYIERTWPSLEEGDVFHNRVRYVRVDINEPPRASKSKSKQTNKGETTVKSVQPTKPITLSKPTKAADYDLPLRNELQWLAQNVSKINHHFELVSYGQTLHVGKSDDEPTSFSAKLVVRQSTIVTSNTLEVTLIWNNVEYIDGVFTAKENPEVFSKEVTDFYDIAERVKHTSKPAISEVFYSAAIHLDYQRGGYLVKQDEETA